jgi:hypothetical protein
MEWHSLNPGLKRLRLQKVKDGFDYLQGKSANQWHQNAGLETSQQKTRGFGPRFRHPKQLGTQINNRCH